MCVDTSEERERRSAINNNSCRVNDPIKSSGKPSIDGRKGELREEKGGV